MEGDAAGPGSGVSAGALAADGLALLAEPKPQTQPSSEPQGLLAKGAAVAHNVGGMMQAAVHKAGQAVVSGAAGAASAVGAAVGLPLLDGISGGGGGGGGGGSEESTGGAACSGSSERAGQQSEWAEAASAHRQARHELELEGDVKPGSLQLDNLAAPKATFPAPSEANVRDVVLSASDLVLGGPPVPASMTDQPHDVQPAAIPIIGGPPMPADPRPSGTAGRGPPRRYAGEPQQSLDAASTPSVEGLKVSLGPAKKLHLPVPLKVMTGGKRHDGDGRLSDTQSGSSPPTSTQPLLQSLSQVSEQPNLPKLSLGPTAPKMRLPGHPTGGHTSPVPHRGMADTTAAKVLSGSVDALAAVSKPLLSKL
ncbi:hypothetical protein V8C86DRAFT_2736969 [Haematococcus lacustris]